MKDTKTCTVPLAFQILKTKQGMAICHCLADDFLVWVHVKVAGVA
jgi:hypothetical protein